MKPIAAPTAEPLSADTISDAERHALREGCDRAIQHHGLLTAADALAELSSLPAADLTSDDYGDGGSVAVLEAEVRALLDKPAAAFMPSGTMAQQIALRVHADRRTAGSSPSTRPATSNCMRTRPISASTGWWAGRWGMAASC